jgi:N-acetylneuraminate synthase
MTLNKKIKSPYVIAEAGVNHNGKFDLARKLIRAAHYAGADCVKFQLFDASKLVTENAPRAKYQKRNTASSDSQYKMLKELELPPSAFVELKKEADSIGIDFLLSPFDLDSLIFIKKKLNLKIIKIPSGEITNYPMLWEAGASFKQVILSTGASTLEDVELALKMIQMGHLRQSPPSNSSSIKQFIRQSTNFLNLIKKVTLLHCVSEYPAPDSQSNLRAILSLGKAFNLSVGFSDHSSTTLSALGATALGSTVIEKHFTLDKNMPGPDHMASLNVEELKQMVSEIRIVSSALGNGKKVLASCEKTNQRIIRKSLVASCSIKKGQRLEASMIGLKRPAKGLSSLHFWRLIESKSKKNLKKEEFF